MTETAADARRHAPATLRNRDAILAVLQGVLPATGLVLEVASGSGEHCAFLAAALPALHFQPSDPDPDAHASIDAWCASLPNVAPALALDCTAPWPALQAQAVLCINMIHISPWAATLGLLAGAAAALPPGGLLYLYGPYRQAGLTFADSNAAFDASLRARNPAWGIRDLEAVTAAAAAQGFGPPAVTPMPANNLSVLFHRG
jgi:SAM-dependent methyltransferase